MVPFTVLDVDAFANGIAAKISDVAMRIVAVEKARGIFLVLLIAVHMRVTSI